MTDKQAVIDALQRLPEDASLEQISEELRVMASIRSGRADVAEGRTKTQAEAEQLLEPTAPNGADRQAAIERLKTFGKTHQLSLGGMTIKQLRDEARP